jgi:GxxExxY protein
MPPHTPEIGDRLTETVIGAAIDVHRALGPGLLESVYRDCLLVELVEARLHVERERRVRLQYKGHAIGGALKLDLLVERSLIVEVKAVELLHPLHLAQVITYLKLTGCPTGLILNFNTTSLRRGIRRVTHPDRYISSRACDETAVPGVRESSDQQVP